MTAKHPAKAARCTKRQIEVFEQIAIGQGDLGGFLPTTVNALLSKGLVTRLPDRVLGRDALGIITVPSYEVPLHHQYEWCKWCSENISDKEFAF